VRGRDAPPPSNNPTALGHRPGAPDDPTLQNSRAWLKPWHFDIDNIALVTIDNLQSMPLAQNVRAGFETGVCRFTHAAGREGYRAGYQRRTFIAGTGHQSSTAASRLPDITSELADQDGAIRSLRRCTWLRPWRHGVALAATIASPDAARFGLRAALSMFPARAARSACRA
jgi:hypothetical protein